MEDNIKNAILCLMVGLFLVGLVCMVYGYYVPKETVTISIIDKWMEVKNGYLTTPMCELEDHRIFRIGAYEYINVELNRPYQMNIFPDRIEIINERWRL